jgi:hypothetical protein
MEMTAFVIMRDMSRHLDEEDLEHYSSGSSREEDSAQYEEHLLTCEDCRLKLLQTEEYLAGMQFAARQVRRDQRAGEKRWNWSLPAWIPTFAAVACLVLVIVVAASRYRVLQPAIAVGLTALRSNGSGITAPAGRSLRLQPDLTGLAAESSYRLEIVGRSGQSLWQGSFSPGPAGVTVPGQAPGLYFVRVYLPQGELVREFGLDVK